MAETRACPFEHKSGGSSTILSEAIIVLVASIPKPVSVHSSNHLQVVFTASFWIVHVQGTPDSCVFGPGDSYRSSENRPIDTLSIFHTFRGSDRVNKSTRPARVMIRYNIPVNVRAVSLLSHSFQNRTPSCHGQAVTNRSTIRSHIVVPFPLTASTRVGSTLPNNAQPTANGHISDEPQPTDPRCKLSEMG
jgi:hypothetical protein